VTIKKRECFRRFWPWSFIT